MCECMSELLLVCVSCLFVSVRETGVTQARMMIYNDTSPLLFRKKKKGGG